ncbi:MAG: hypothetical protein HYT93_04125 [Parcubacteria group bacterium]|nr:hypothetical protein [Parcubacteria group bacterium]
MNLVRLVYFSQTLVTALAAVIVAWVFASLGGFAPHLVVIAVMAVVAAAPSIVACGELVMLVPNGRIFANTIIVGEAFWTMDLLAMFYGWSSKGYSALDTVFSLSIAALTLAGVLWIVPCANKRQKKNKKMLFGTKGGI